MQILGRNDPCWCGSGQKYKKCHEAFDRRLSSFEQQGLTLPSREIIKTRRQIDGIRESGKRNIEVLDTVASRICAGMSTLEIDRIVSETTKKLGGICAPLDYEGFPKSVCTSVNDQVCHGIPSADDILQEGDIVNVDVSTIYGGFFSDSSRMFIIGETSPEAKKLVETTKECVEAGIAATRPWGTLNEMAKAVYARAAREGYSIVREIGGHGVGLEFHEDPWVGYTEDAGQGILLVPGMVFTIEPMVNMGRPEIFCDEENGWTIYTEDGLPSAQWEVTVAVTETGTELLAW
ncbi:MAG: methionyl aminopeptidase [Clostridia bacterium]|nr:methionyl aminopeptidase [Clostridia bacterium]